MLQSAGSVEKRFLPSYCSMSLNIGLNMYESYSKRKKTRRKSLDFLFKGVVARVMSPVDHVNVMSKESLMQLGACVWQMVSWQMVRFQA